MHFQAIVRASFRGAIRQVLAGTGAASDIENVPESFCHRPPLPSPALLLPSPFCLRPLLPSPFCLRFSCSDGLDGLRVGLDAVAGTSIESRFWGGKRHALDNRL